MCVSSLSEGTTPPRSTPLQEAPIKTSLIRRRLLAPVAAAALVAGTLVVAVPALRASAAPGPFVCAPGFYQVSFGQLKELNPVTGTYVNIGTVDPTYPTYNAMGYDTLNNYLYALSTSAGTQGDLLRIADDGSITD
ncbi:MAG: hypothetical protein ABSC35_07760, partial [Candidatus Dormibacteria bacterium]